MREQHDFHDLDDRLESLDVDSSWKTEHRQQLKNRILQDVEKKKSGTSHFERFPYKYYFSLGAAALILWILVAPSFQALFSEWNLVTSGDGPQVAGTMLRVILTVFTGSFFLIGTVLLFRYNERAKKLFSITNGFGLLSDTMREIVRRSFILLVILLVFYLLQTKIQFYVNDIVSILYLLTTGALAVWIGSRLENRVSKLSYSYPIQIIGSLLVILYIGFQMFTPYFFPENHLIQSGIEKIEIYYEAIGDNDLTIEERIELAKIPYGSRAEFQFSHREYMEEYWEDKGGIIQRDYNLINLVDFSRRYHEYTLIVEVEVQWYEDEQLQNNRELWQYTFTREEGDFRIIGSGSLSN